MNEHCGRKKGVWEWESDKRSYEKMGVERPRKASKRGMGSTEGDRKNKKDRQDTWESWEKWDLTILEILEEMMSVHGEE